MAKETQTWRTDLDTVGKERSKIWENSIETRTLPCVKQIGSGSLLYDAGNEPKAGALRQPRGWEGKVGGRWAQEGGDMYLCLWLIHVDVWQRPTQYCKAIILPLKINTFKQIKLKWMAHSESSAQKSLPGFWLFDPWPGTCPLGLSHIWSLPGPKLPGAESQGHHFLVVRI